MQELEELLKTIVTIQGILVIAFIIQLIANLIIIFQLPKIKKYTNLIFQKMYGLEITEELNKSNSSKINEKAFLPNTLIGIVIGLILIGIIMILSMFFSLYS